MDHNRTMDAFEFYPKSGILALHPPYSLGFSFRTCSEEIGHFQHPFTAFTLGLGLLHRDDEKPLI